MKREEIPENSGYPFLFSSLKFSGYKTKNRLVALPVHTGFAYPDGHVSPLMVKWYTRMAKSGVGMVIVATAAEEHGRLTGVVSYLEKDLAEKKKN
jgi:2,4-dienoyl-CoA reductase-like NADH-dependent reductase (Old Yellow Enzyme family)